MCRKILFIAFLFITNQLLAQSKAYSNFMYDGVSFDVYIVCIDSISLKKFDILDNINKLPNDKMLNLLKSKASCFASNACINDATCKPLGLFIKNGIEINPINTNDGKGNFYLKPNGALLILHDDVVICESSEIKKYSGIQIGVQSGPMLLNQGSVNPQFNPNSNNYQKRLGVGTYCDGGKKYIVFCISNEAITFHKMAMIFYNKFKCQNALTLECSGCVMTIPQFNTSSETNNNIICNYLYFTP